MSDLTAWEIKRLLDGFLSQVEVVGENGKPTDIICSGTVQQWNALLKRIRQEVSTGV